MEYDLNESGIFIDIYTIENIPDSKIKKWGQGIICMFMGFTLSCRRMAKGYKIFKNYQNGISLKNGQYGQIIGIPGVKMKIQNMWGYPQTIFIILEKYIRDLSFAVTKK